jgi:hypothetical protein
VAQINFIVLTTGKAGTGKETGRPRHPQTL